MCQLPPIKPHNAHLADLFPEATHAEFFRRKLECNVGFEREEIQLSLIITTEGNVHSLQLNVHSGSLNVRWGWYICQFQHFGKRYPTDKYLETTDQQIDGSGTKMQKCAVC